MTALRDVTQHEPDERIEIAGFQRHPRVGSDVDDQMEGFAIGVKLDVGRLVDGEQRPGIARYRQGKRFCNLGAV